MLEKLVQLSPFEIKTDKTRDKVLFVRWQRRNWLKNLRQLVRDIVIF